MHHRHLMLLVALAAPLGACDQSPADPADAARDLDISAYTRTFEEGFEKLDVSAWGPGTKWIAHTPWHGDFGDATFEDPTPGLSLPDRERNPAHRGAQGRGRQVALGPHLVARPTTGPAAPASRSSTATSRWRRCCPRGSGVWPAFWLVGITPKPRAEIDVPGILRQRARQLPRQRPRLGGRRRALRRWQDRPNPARQRERAIQPLRRARRGGLGDLLLQPARSVAHTDAAGVSPTDVHASQSRAGLWLAPSTRCRNPSFMYIKSTRRLREARLGESRRLSRGTRRHGKLRLFAQGLLSVPPSRHRGPTHRP